MQLLKPHVDWAKFFVLNTTVSNHCTELWSIDRNVIVFIVPKEIWLNYYFDPQPNYLCSFWNFICFEVSIKPNMSFVSYIIKVCCNYTNYTKNNLTSILLRREKKNTGLLSLAIKKKPIKSSFLCEISL